jgi:DNA primase
MYYSEDIIEEVLSRNDVVDVIGTYVHLTKKGANYWGLCPFHGEKTPSFSVNSNKQMFYCFGCHKGGSVITFLMEYENLTFPEAVQELAARSGITLPDIKETE